MKRIGLSFFIAGLLAMQGCVSDLDKPDQDDTKGGGDGKAEGWGSSDSAGLFNENLNYKLADMPAVGEATNIPWAGSYWPTYQDNINKKWRNAPSAAALYGEAFGVAGVEDAVSEAYGVDHYSTRTKCSNDSACDSSMAEQCAKREGASEGFCIPSWWGICHAWGPASIMEPEPEHEVEHNGVTFKVQDIKALMTLAYNRTESRFVSLRCNENNDKDEIEYDGYNRPTGSDTECRDTNPGTFHILIANYLGLQGESFVYDRTFDYQVWNQPLRGYKVTKLEEITSQKANQLIGVQPTGGATSEASGTVAKDVWSHQAAQAVSAGDQVSITMTGTGDADLYVRFGSQPTATDYDCRPYDSGSAEICNVVVPVGASQVFVSVNGYAATSNFTLKTIVGGGVPTDYVFNDKATKFYNVAAEVYYISEAPSSRDGNLSSTIDSYTHTDHYEYVLELNDAGNIIGGEWLNDSKTAHPDFVWLPLRHRDASVAGGKIKYEDVKLLLDKSRSTDTGNGGSGELRSLNESGTVAKGEWKHYGPFNVAPGKTLTANLTGGGDADLYVRNGAAPTSASYDCRPYKNGSTEGCTVAQGGKVYVSVQGYAASSEFALEISYTEGAGTEPPVEPPTTFTHLEVTDTVATGETKMFELAVPAGKKVVVRTFSANDIDLYIQANQAPTTDAYLARGYTTSGNEVLNHRPSSNIKLYIMVHGYEGGSFTLRTADN